MTDASILYAGILCFSLTLLGFVLTIAEFRRMSRSKQAAAALVPAGTHGGRKKTFETSSASTAHPYAA
jgi:hypothetical protein